MIVASDLTKEFGRHRVLDGVNLRVRRGEMVVLLGPSGAGKSTLLRCLNGLLLPTTGTVTVDGIPLARKSLGRVRRRVGFIFQEFHLVENLSVLKNVLIGRLAEKPAWSLLFTKTDREISSRALHAVGLSEKAGAKAGTLSGGQKQRVAIARALAHDPAILLADEPISNLDPKSGGDVLALLRMLNREGGTTIVCNLHGVSEALRVADRIVGLRAGRIVFDGPPSTVDPDDLARLYGAAKHQSADAGPARFTPQRPQDETLA